MYNEAFFVKILINRIMIFMYFVLTKIVNLNTLLYYFLLLFPIKRCVFLRLSI
jgi:hypothetical protein